MLGPGHPPRPRRNLTAAAPVRDPSREREFEDRSFILIVHEKSDSESDAASDLELPPPSRGKSLQTGDGAAVAIAAKRSRQQAASSDSASDSDQHTPKANSVRTPRKATRATTNLSLSATSLFNVVIGPSSGIAAAVSDWIEDYGENDRSALEKLITFVLHTSGCFESIDAADLEDEDLMKEALEQLQAKLESSENYPLIAKKTSGRGTRTSTTSAKFRTNLKEFWTKWFLKLKNLPTNSPIFTTQDSEHEDSGTPQTVFETVKTWLTLMSSSAFRAFRHTATTTILVLMSSLCDASATVYEEWTTLNRQLDALKKDSSGKTKSAKAERISILERDVDDLAGKKWILEKHMSDLFESVFIHRYRDIDAIIRMECIRELGFWVAKFPEHYLDANYLRYIGWMLSDSVSRDFLHFEYSYLLIDAPSVRLESLKSLHTLYKSPTTHMSLRAFTERFKPRLLEMALRDRSTASGTSSGGTLSVRATAVDVVADATRAGLVSDADRAAAQVLVFCRVDAHTRERVSAFVAQCVREAVDAARQDALAIAAADGNAEEDGETASAAALVHLEWVDWKAFVQEMVQIAREMQKNIAGRRDAIVSKVSAIGSSLEVVSSSVAQEAERESLSDDEMDEDDLDEEAKEKILAMLKFNAELREWCLRDEHEFLDNTEQKRSDREGDLLVVGSGNMTAAISGLLGSVDLLKEWEAALEYVSTDLSMGNSEERLSSNEADIFHLHTLSSDEEYFLILAVNAVLLATAGIGHSVGAKQKSIDQSEQKLNCSRVLMKYIPKLLKKYGNEYGGPGFRILVEIVKMIRNLDPVVYLELRMLKAYESLLDDLVVIFLRQSRNEIIREFMTTWNHLCGITEGENFQHGSPRKGSQAVDLRINSSAASASLHQQATEKLEVAVDSQILPNVLSFGTRFEGFVNSSAENVLTEDALVSLTANLRRLLALSSIVDISKLTPQHKQSSGGAAEGSLFETLLTVLQSAMKYQTAAFRRMDALGAIAVQSELKVNHEVSDLSCLVIELLAHFSLCVVYNLVHEKGPEVPEFQEQRVVQFVRFCESVLMDNDLNECSVGAKLSCVRALMDVFLALRFSKVGGVLGKLYMSWELQNALISFGTKCFESVGIVDVGLATKTVRNIWRSHPRLTQTSSPNHESPEAAEASMLNLLNVCAGLCNLLSHGVLKPSFAPLLLQFTGIPEPTVQQPFMVLPSSVATKSSERNSFQVFEAPKLFGAGWDYCMETLLTRFINDRVAQYLIAFEEKDRSENEENEASAVVGVEEVRSVIEDAGAIIGDSLIKSLDLFASGKLASLQHFEFLSRSIRNALKSWITQLGDSEGRDRVYLQGAATRSLLQMLRAFADRMTMLYQLANHASEQLVYGEEFTCRRLPAELTPVWELAAPLGGLVSQIASSFGVEYEPQPDDAGIASAEDVLEYASNSLAAKGIKPDESSDLWHPYWNFVKAVQKGDSKQKRGRKKNPAKASGADVSPKDGTVKKRGRPPKKDKPSPAEKKPRSAVKKVQTKSASQVEDSDGSGSDHMDLEVRIPLGTRRSKRQMAKRGSPEDRDVSATPSTPTRSTLGKRSAAQLLVRKAGSDGDGSGAGTHDVDAVEDDDDEVLPSSPESLMRTVKRIRV
ncbi:hypothetical protein HDU84_003906 [Entophlyctis sp. JEL0112]|nr:hypothetical protein HDU84_003906 [Entophlyctis sp. JEL0112]